MNHESHSMILRDKNSNDCFVLNGFKRGPSSLDETLNELVQDEIVF